MLKLDIKSLMRGHDEAQRVIAALARPPLTRDAVLALATAPRLAEVRRVQAAAAAAFRDLFAPLTE